MNLKKPYFWDLKKPNYISYILTPFTLPIILRNFFFNLLKKKNFSKIKTICIGNIYLGGTGKTPLTIKIFEILKKHNHKVATVKKFYKNQIDEQLLLKEATSAIISKSRKNALYEGIKNKYEILLFDDGLQDIEIDYDKKIVCFKINNWIGNGQLIPAGPLREKISSLKRFDALFLNGSNNNIHEYTEQIKKINPNIKIFKSKYRIKDIYKYDLNSEYLIFSGIGNPKDFKSLMLENNFKIKKEVLFTDHFNYSSKNLEDILNLARNEKLKIMTTSKDYIKLPKYYKKEISCLDIDLEIENQNELIDFLIN